MNTITDVEQTKLPKHRYWLLDLEYIKEQDNMALDKEKNNRYKLKNNLILYPLQFSHSDRLKEHRVAYIFDEVGSGKTITSAIMALDFLRDKRNQEKKILVITTSALAGPANSKNTAKASSFLSDWFDKLPFSEEDKQRIKIIGNDHNNIKHISEEMKKNNKKEQIGLIIIDEAHLFINKGTQRFKQLIKLRSDFVVFLTATPIKLGETNQSSNKDSGIKDLYIYHEIAQYLLSRELDDSWIKKLLNVSSKEDLICNKFSLDTPVSRYFKDTIAYLQKSEVRDKTKRYDALLWVTDNQTNTHLTREEQELQKLITLETHISDIVKNNCESQLANRFIVFTRFVNGTTLGASANDIGRYLKNQGFIEWESAFKREAVLEIEKLKNEIGEQSKANVELQDEINAILENYNQKKVNQSNSKTYYVITGDNKTDLKLVSRNFKLDDKQDKCNLLEDLPTVLILTYQIAEQGVNLPDYNYVVNYHIPAYSAALEQRYGRIDRMNSEYKEIYICYLLSNGLYDLNTWNYYFAIENFKHQVLTALPSRNTVLSSGNLDELLDWTEVRKYLERIISYCEGAYQEHEVDIGNFAISHEIELNNENELEIKKLVMDKAKKLLSRIEAKESSDKNKQNKKLVEDLKVSQNILYEIKSEEVKVSPITPIDCGKNILYAESNEFKKYEHKLYGQLDEAIKLQNQFDSLKDKLERLFQNYWNNNQVEYIYPELVGLNDIEEDILIGNEKLDYFDLTYLKKNLDIYSKSIIISREEVTRIATMLVSTYPTLERKRLFQAAFAFVRYKDQLQKEFKGFLRNHNFESIFPESVGKTYRDIFNAHPEYDLFIDMLPFMLEEIMPYYKYLQEYIREPRKRINTAFVKNIAYTKIDWFINNNSWRIEPNDDTLNKEWVTINHNINSSQIVFHYWVKFIWVIILNSRKQTGWSFENLLLYKSDGNHGRKDTVRLEFKEKFKSIIELTDGNSYECDDYITMVICRIIKPTANFYVQY